MWVWLHRAAPVDCSLSPTVFPLPHASIEALGFAHSCPAWWKEVCVSVRVCVCVLSLRGSGMGLCYTGNSGAHFRGDFFPDFILCCFFSVPSLL